MSDVTLDADTQYILNFDSTGNAAGDLVLGTAGSDDQTGSTGWTIEDTLRSVGNTHGNNSLMIDVRGNAVAPPPSVRFEYGTYTVTEGDSTTVKVILSEALDSAATISIASKDQNGATSSDYSGVPGSVEFSSGDTEKSFTFTATTDSVVDDGESVKLTFTDLPEGLTKGNPAETTVEIDDTTRLTYVRRINPNGTSNNSLNVSGRYKLSIHFTPSATGLTEGDLEIVGSTVIGITTRVVSNTNVWDVDLETDAGASTTTVRVPADVVDGGNQPGELTFTVVDPLTPTFTTSASEPVVANFQVTLRFSQDVTVLPTAFEGDDEWYFTPTEDIEVSHGSLHSHSRVSNREWTLTISPNSGVGTTEVSLPANRVATNSDLEVWNSAANISLAAGKRSVSFGEPAYTVAEGAGTTVSVKLDADPLNTVVIPLVVTPQGGATSAQDYSGIPTSVTFNSGETEVSFTFQATDDTVDDDGESVKIEVGTPLPAIIKKGTQKETVVSITDDDGVPPDDATLSALELTDSESNTVELTPTFQSSTTTYTAAVENDIDVITVTPTKSNANATVKYLDDADQTLADADTETDDHQVSLDLGANTFKVEVTSPDTTVIQTYTLTVTRLNPLLVKNTHISTGTNVLRIGFDENGRSGQRFTTGSNATGYEVTSVGIYIEDVNYSGSETLTARIHEFAGSNFNDLGNRVATLETPTLVAGEINYFKAPNGTILAADTEYILNFHSTGNIGSDLEIRVVESDDEMGATGWSIENQRRTGGSTTGSDSIVIEVRGIAVELSDDATLSALDLTDSGDNAVALEQTFDAATTEYTATVEEAIEQVTVTPTVGDDGASIEYLDENDQALDDADTNTDEFDISLAVGANTFKVKATAQDNIATATYTVVVTRLADNTLVTNTQLEAAQHGLNIGHDYFGTVGQRFTTGSHATGYEITSVGIYVASEQYSGDETVAAHIHEFDESATNDLGDQIAVLTTPTLTAGEVNYFDAPAGTRLDPSTRYILVFYSTGNAPSDLELRLAGSDDQTGATGWLIEDDHRINGSLISGGASIKIEVRGNLYVPSDDATLSDLELTDLNGNTITLAPAFDAATTSYTATVDEVVDVLTITPTKGDDGATIAYLDSANQTLSDADTEMEGHQVSLDLGQNTFKVRVTSEDGNTTETYTVVVNRTVWEATLTLSDLGQGGNLGCADTVAGGKCSDIGNLSDDEFTYDGTEYTVLFAKRLSADELQFSVSPVWAGNANRLILHVDSQEFELGNADFTTDTATYSSTYWDSPGLSWSVGQAVALKLALIPASDDATLSDLEITDTDGTDVSLDPTFDPATTSYTATVENDIDLITVMPTKGDVGAILEYLDDADQTLADARGANGHQVSLRVGPNTFKLKVTSSDTNSTETYTVVVTRLASVLVKNTHLTRTDRLEAGDARNGSEGQRFTAGSHTSGYLLTSVGLFVVADHLANTETITARIHEFDDGATNDLGNLVAVLTTPELVANEVNYFEAPADTILDASSQYILNFHSTADAATDVKFGIVESDDEMGAAGWSIEDRRRSGGSTVGSRSVMMEVWGIARELSDDATLSALVLEDSDGNTVALAPTFDGATTSYTATVDNDVDLITVTPTKGDRYANIEHQDGSGQSLADADAAAGQQVSLQEGDNTFSVKVTSSDTTETKTYTVVVTRLTDNTLVKNTHLSKTSDYAIGTSQDGSAGQRFTTGNHVGGYEVTSVGIYISSGDYSGSETVTVRIHKFDDTQTNDLGDQIAVLTTPTLTAGEVNYFDAPSDTALDSGTEYIVNFHSTGDTATDLELGLVSSDEETGASGWFIENDRRLNGGPSAGDTSIMIEVRGNARVPSDDSSLSDLVLEDSNGNTIRLSPAFDSLTADYTATVDRVIDGITFTPTKGDDGASIEYLDGINQTLEDGDTDTEEFDVSLAVGINTFELNVTAEDNVTLSSYTVVVTRLQDSTLVKNTHLSALTPVSIGTERNGSIGQRFTTGNNAAGYEVTSVGVDIIHVGFSGGETVTVRIHRFDDSATNDLGDLVAVLETPSLREDRVNVFNAPDGTTLAASTQYIVNFHSTGSVGNDLRISTVFTNEQMGAQGWLIEDAYRDNGSLSSTTQSLKMEVRGNASDPADSTLNDVELTDSNGADIALDPAFHSGTTSYTAEVDNEIAVLTVTPRKGAHGASVEYLDENNATLDDSGTNTDGHQVSLEEGENTFKVKVTSTDANSTATYTFVVTRLTDITLVRNTHLSSPASYQMGDTGDSPRGQRFTTGSHADGYDIASIGVHIREVDFSGSETMTLGLHRFNESAANDLGLLVATLSPPTFVEGEVNYFETPSGTTLDPDTQYIVSFNTTGDSLTDLILNTHSSNDQTGAEGWLIEDAFRRAGSLSGTGLSIMIEVRGRLAPDRTVPELASATVEGDQLVLTYNEDIDEDSIPATSAYSVTVGTGAAAEPSGVSISGTAVTLTLVAAAAAGEDVSVTYAVPSTNPVQDVSGNDAGPLTARAVTNYALTPLLVSNAEKSRTTSPTVDSGTTYVQRFETGSNGAFLHSVTLTGIANLESGDVPEVGVYTNDSNTPGTLLATLENPTTLGNGDQVFRVSPGTTVNLAPGTQYFIRIAALSGAFDITTTSSNDEDSDRLSGWTVYDWSRTFDGSSYTNSTNVVRMQLRGIEIDPSLSAVEITDSDGNTVTLSPAFDAETTSYTASVDQFISEVTVATASGDDDASIEYLDISDQPLPDADTFDEEQQVSLDIGRNTFKVQVTARDKTTTRTYTVVVERGSEVTLVSNTDATAFGSNFNMGHNARDHYRFEFTTGIERDRLCRRQVRPLRRISKSSVSAKTATARYTRPTQISVAAPKWWNFYLQAGRSTPTTASTTSRPLGTTTSSRTRPTSLPHSVTEMTSTTSFSSSPPPATTRPVSPDGRLPTATGTPATS